eukprot:6224335-Prorocentrum_lima.AAC.1
MSRLESTYVASTDRPLVDIEHNPTFAVLDLGCTKSMALMRAILAFEEAKWEYGITLDWKC